MTKFKNIFLTIVAIVISFTAINAAPVSQSNAFLGEEPLSVKFIGTEGDYLLFEVIVNADTKNRPSFNISDKAEGEIYTASINSNNKVQTMKIEKRDNQELDFKLVIGKNQYSKSFAVLTTVTMETK